MIAVSRVRGHQETRNYIARRSAEGKTPREARRCIKHYTPDASTASSRTRP